MSAGYIEVPGICQRVLRVLRPTRGAPQPETTRHAAMDHGPPSQNGPPAKKAKKKVVQALLDFTGGKVTTGATGTGAEGIARGERTELMAQATIKEKVSRRAGYADADLLVNPGQDELHDFCEKMGANAFQAIDLSGKNVGPA